jgi:hypothetical protein
VKAWLQRHAVGLMASLTILVASLTIIVIVQATMLRSTGWTVPIGNVAEWVAAVSTLAAFGTLTYAGREWKSKVEDRNSLEHDRQAADKERQALAREREDERRDRESEQARLIVPEIVEDQGYNEYEVVVRNRSTSDVMNVQAYAYWGGGRCSRLILAPGEATEQFHVRKSAPDNSFVTLSFTDSHGRQWKREGMSPPVRMIEPEK